MAYVIYNKETTILFYVRGKHLGVGCTKDTWKSEAAALAALTKAVNAGKIERDDYAISEESRFIDRIEKHVERTNAMTGETYIERVNEPSCCSPSSETYWSM